MTGTLDHHIAAREHNLASMNASKPCALLDSDMMKAVGVGAGVLAAGVAAYSLFWWYEGEKCEKPDYSVIKVLKTEKSLFRGERSVIEMRHYSGYLIAEVTVRDATMKEASTKGFRSLAGFIFGKNKGVGQDSKENISMTAPVRMEMVGTAEPIAMTAPVRTQEVSASSADPLLSESDKSTFKVSFTMPSKYTLDTLPKPDNEDITITEVPAHDAVALKFSGPRPSRAVVEKKSKELAEAMQADGMLTDGDVVLAQFHPPFAPNWIRLNEVVYKIRPAGYKVAE